MEIWAAFPVDVLPILYSHEIMMKRCQRIDVEVNCEFASGVGSDELMRAMMAEEQEESGKK